MAQRSPLGRFSGSVSAANFICKAMLSPTPQAPRSRTPPSLAGSAHHDSEQLRELLRHHVLRAEFSRVFGTPIFGQSGRSNPDLPMSRLSIFMVLVAAAPFAAGEASAQETIKIGAVQSMTGSFNPIGKQVMAGTRLRTRSADDGPNRAHLLNGGYRFRKSGSSFPFRL